MAQQIAPRGEIFIVTDGGMHHHLAASGNLGQIIRKNYPVAVGNRMAATGRGPDRGPPAGGRDRERRRHHGRGRRQPGQHRGPGSGRERRRDHADGPDPSGRWPW